MTIEGRRTGLDERTTTDTETAFVAAESSKIGEISQSQLMVRRFKRASCDLPDRPGYYSTWWRSSPTFLSPNIRSGRPEPTIRRPSSLTWSGGPGHVHGRNRRSTSNISTTYVKDCSNPIPLKFFGQGFEYKFLGLIPADRT